MCLCRSRRNHPILPCLSRALLECCLSENTVYHNMIVYYCIIVWPRSLCRFSLGSSFSPASQFRFHSLYTRSTRLIKKIFHFPSVMRSQRGADEKKRSWPLTSDIPYIFLSFFLPQSVAFILILVISGSQNDISTTSLISGLRKKKKKGTRRSGAGPATDSRRTLRA